MASDTVYTKISGEPVNKDDLLETLRQTEDIADDIADQHRHGCPVGEIATAISATCRETRNHLAGKGPAQVATDDYRRNWEGIFGSKSSWGQA